MKIAINYNIKNRYIIIISILLVLFFGGRFLLCDFANNADTRFLSIKTIVNLALGTEQFYKNKFINTRLNKLAPADSKYTDPAAFEKLKNNLNKVSYPSAKNEYCNCSNRKECIGISFNEAVFDYPGAFKLMVEVLERPCDFLPTDLLIEEAAKRDNDEFPQLHYLGYTQNKEILGCDLPVEERVKEKIIVSIFGNSPTNGEPIYKYHFVIQRKE